MRDALEAVLLGCLRRPPCLVAFSGGRDSAGILALATSVARRHGLPLPVPATNTVVGDERSAEGDWQRRVIQHLGLPDWHELRWEAGELDLIGPLAQTVLRAYGTVYPSNAHFIVPLARAAQGGTLLTGVGGDELFLIRSRFSMLRSSLTEPGDRRRRAPRAAIEALLPPALHARRSLDLDSVAGPWVQPEAQADLRLRLLADATALGWRWSTTITRGWWQAKRRQAHVRTLDTLTADYDVAVVHPFMTPEVLGAAVGAAPLAGFANRTGAMTGLFGDVLPPEVIARRSKAVFDEVFFSPLSRRLMAGWDGDGLDDIPIDPARLQEAWSRPEVDARSSYLLQELWRRTSG